MRLLSMDPGKTGHFAYSLLDSGKCIKTGLLWSIEDLTPDAFKQNYIKFAKQIKQLIADSGLDSTQGDRIVLERYITRPHMGMGNASEFINIMIGIIVMVALPVSVVAIPSSQWKNYMRKKYDIGKDTSKNKKPKKKKSTKKMTKPKPIKLPCKYEDVLDFLTKTNQFSKEDKSIVVHEADALGIGVYWLETLTGKDVLPSVLSGISRTDKK